MSFLFANEAEARSLKIPTHRV